MNDIVNILKSGGVVAIPTDTVYGLICDATNISAINKIFDIKNRDKNKAISIFVKNISDVEKYVNGLNDSLYSIMKEHWPGALTIIFKKKNNILPGINPGKDTIGIRIPKNEFILRLLNIIDFPLAQTSCNISGEPPYYISNEIKRKFCNKIDYIVPGVLDKNSISSTVIDVSKGTIIVKRQGDVFVKEEF